MAYSAFSFFLDSLHPLTLMTSPLKKEKSPGVSDMSLARLTDPCTEQVSSNDSTGVGSPKTPIDDGVTADTTVVTYEPYLPALQKGSIALPQNILFLRYVPLKWSFEKMYEIYCVLGKIEKISLRLQEGKFWEVWISFTCPEDAIKARDSTADIEKEIKCSLVSTAPKTLDVYHPAHWQPSAADAEQRRREVIREPKPARWLIATAKTEKPNYFSFRKSILRKVGDISPKDITRFGRNSLLIHTKSDIQSLMLTNMEISQDDIIKEVKPHYNFSYGKGVAFNEDLYEFDEEVILEMCPEDVWKVFKVPNSSMIILTFIDSTVLPRIYVDNLSIPVRPYRPRPLQCFNCFKYGHPSRVCLKNKLCEVCSQQEHGDCSRQLTCANCHESHKSRDKACSAYKHEEAALQKAQDDHISVGFAKKLLAKRKYADVAKKGTDMPVIPSFKAPPRPPGGTEAASNAPAAPSIPPSQAAPQTCGGAVAASNPPAAPSITERDSGNLSLSEISSQTNEETSQAESLPSLEVNPHRSGAENTSASGNIPSSPTTTTTTIVVHRDGDGIDMEAQAIRQKRMRTPSPSPPSSPSQVLPTNNRFEALTKVNELKSIIGSSKHVGSGRRSSGRSYLGRPSLSRPSSSHDDTSQRRPSKKSLNK